MKNGSLKKMIGSLVFMFASVACSIGAADQSVKGLPTLHKIETYTFQAPYSCNGSYDKSALFLSDYSKGMNSPDLLFNGSCGSPMYIEASTAGDDFSVIADLGNVPLASVSASKAFNYQGVVGQENTFKESMVVMVGHTYAVLITKSDIRALFVLHVDNIAASGQMKISYAVKSYSIQLSQNVAPGFDWGRGNQ